MSIINEFIKNKEYLCVSLKLWQVNMTRLWTSPSSCYDYTARQTDTPPSLFVSHISLASLRDNLDSHVVWGRVEGWWGLDGMPQGWSGLRLHPPSESFSVVCHPGQRRRGCRGWLSEGWRRAGWKLGSRPRCWGCRRRSWLGQESQAPGSPPAAGWPAVAGPAGSGRRHGDASPSPCADRKNRSSAPCCSHCMSHWPCDHSSSSSARRERERKKRERDGYLLES